MDEKEQADRMAAAEALYMISTRVEKSGPLQKTKRRGRKKKNNDYVEDITAKRKGGIEKDADVTVNTSSRRGRAKRVVHEGRGAGGSRGGGRGGKGGSSSPRSRGGAGKSSNSTKGQQRKSVDYFNDESSQQKKSPYRQPKRNPTGVEKILHEHDTEVLKQKSKSRTTKVRGQRIKSNSSSSGHVDYSNVQDIDDESYQAIGFTGASISISESSNRRNSVDSSSHLQSQGLVSGFRQVSLTSRTLPSTASMFGLPSMNLTSFTPDLNLPSIPLEFGSLQLSSQPTPNLSSLGDMAEGVMEDDCSSTARKNSEKFLPLKKRKLHNPSEVEVREPTPLVETSISDSEERPEPQLSPLSVAEPIRASFTVQAPPIITMQTLMEIKTALTADDDGDLPLHIAVVHENMRMVIKLINLMRIAGKGVDKFNKQQQTPLHLAVKLNFLDAIDILLKSNANINAVDCTGSSCIHMAVQGRSTECLTSLLERCPHADLNVRNFDGLTPLHIAVDNGDLHQVETLLKYNADIDVTDGKSGRTALFRAAESNQKAMVELLLAKGANPDVPNYAGVTTAMAAQGRNLHGVLKLLGSIATDKFTEYDTKPSGLALESKVYLGFPCSDNVTKGINLPKHTEPEIKCFLEPKISTDTAEMPSNETKVFHNVFVVSQSKDKSQEIKSKSEPSSPEVKMEVIEDKDRERVDRGGLMSLPEGIFSNSDEQRATKLFVRQRSIVSVQQGGIPTTSEMKLQIPVSYSKLLKNAVPIAQRDQQKSMLQVVSQPISIIASKTVVGSLALPSSAVSSNLLLKSSNSVSSTTFQSNLPSGSSDTVTLTGMQARLFQMLLKMYNIDPTNETPTCSVDSQPISSPVSLMPPKISSTTLSSLIQSPTLSPTATLPYQKHDNVGRHQISKNTGGPVVSNLVENRTENISSHNFNQHVIFSHPKLMEGVSKYDCSSENCEQEKVDESPLNLSTTSNRKDNSESSNRGSLTLKKFDVVGSPNRTVHPFSSADGGISVVTGVKPGLSPVHFGSKGKVISIGVHRISDNDKVVKDRSGQFEMFLLPTSGQSEVPVTSSSRQFEAASLTTAPVARAVSVSNFSQDKSGAKQPEQKHSGEIIQDNHHSTTSVSQKTASIVRDYLTQQNQLRVHNLTSLATLSSEPQSPIQAVPAILELAAETTTSSLQKKHVITLTRNSFSHTSMGKTSPITCSPVSSTLLLPTVSSSPIFLHQGQVIDLSRSKVTESSVMSTSNFSSSSSSSDSGQGKIIGFSGAILSVPSSTTDRSEKRLPKEMPLKEPPKKRGRKGQKSVEGSTLATESGLGKINSETDEKLKKFLGAKKIENSFSVLPDSVDEILGQLDEQSNGVDMEDSVIQEPRSRLTEGQTDQTYKTVGIFSGNVQHVKYGKKLAISPSLGTSNPVVTISMPLPASSPSSIDNKPTDSLTSGISIEEHTDNTGITVVTSLVTVSTDTAGKSCNKQTILNTAIKNSSNSNKEVSDNNDSNFPSYSLNSLSKTMGSNLLVSSDPPVTKHSDKLFTPSLFVVIESRDPIPSIMSTKGQSSQSGIFYETDSDNSSGSFVCGKIEKFESSKGMKQTVHLREEFNSYQEQKIKGKNLLLSTSLQTRKDQDEISVKSNNVQTHLSDLFKKESKLQKQNNPDLQRNKQIQKYASVHTSQQLPVKSTVIPSNTETEHDLSSRTDASSKGNQKASLTDLRDSRHTEVSDMEFDDEDEPPNLCIEESEEID